MHSDLKDVDGVTQGRMCDDRCDAIDQFDGSRCALRASHDGAHQLTPDAPRHDATLYDSRREVCDTWIGNELVTIDVSCLWGQTFAEWESLVDTETAARIASATVAVLQSCQSSEVQS